MSIHIAPTAHPFHAYYGVGFVTQAPVTAASMSGHVCRLFQGRVRGGAGLGEEAVDEASRKDQVRERERES